MLIKEVSIKEGLEGSGEPRKSTVRAMFDQMVGETDFTNIHVLLVVRRIKQINIAKKYNFGVAEVNKVVHGRRRTRRIREAIAQELGFAVEELWKD